MFLLLATLVSPGFAADPAYVLLGRDAPLCPGPAEKGCQVVETPKNAVEPWRDARTWKVVKDEGAWLQVEDVTWTDVPGGACVGGAPVLGGLQVRAWVPRRAVVKAVTKTTTVKGTDGSSLTVAPGHAASLSGNGASGGTVEIVGEHVYGRVTFPEDAIGETWSPAPLPPPSLNQVATLVYSIAWSLEGTGTGTLRRTDPDTGLPAVELKSGVEGVAAPAMDGEVFAAASDGAFTTLTPLYPMCQSLTIPHVQRSGALAAKALPAAKWEAGVKMGTATVSSLAAGIAPGMTGTQPGTGTDAGAGGGTGPFLAAGAPLLWPDGSAAGTVEARIAMPEGEEKRGKRCFDAWDGKGTLTVCAAVK